MSSGSAQISTNANSGEEPGVIKVHNNCQSIDCKFIVGSQAEVILGNRMTFALESCEFEKLLCDGATAEVRLADDDPTTFRNLRYIIYNKNICLWDRFSLHEIVDIFKLCAKYEVVAISLLCRSHIKVLLDSKTIPNVLKAYYFALEVDDSPLAESVMWSLSLQIKESEIKESENLLVLFSEMDEFFGKLPPSTSTETRKTIRKTCLAGYDFGRLTLEEFIHGPGDSHILSCEEKYYLLSRKLVGMPFEVINEKSKSRITLGCQFFT